LHLPVSPVYSLISTYTNITRNSVDFHSIPLTILENSPEIRYDPVTILEEPEFGLKIDAEVVKK